MKKFTCEFKSNLTGKVRRFVSYAMNVEEFKYMLSNHLYSFQNEINECDKKQIPWAFSQAFNVSEIEHNTDFSYGL